jgi:hypothetical protein
MSSNDEMDFVHCFAAKICSLVLELSSRKRNSEDNKFEPESIASMALSERSATTGMFLVIILYETVAEVPLIPRKCIHPPILE